MTRRKADNGAQVLTAIELVDLVRSAISREAAVDLVQGFCRVVASSAALEATRETYARVDEVLTKKTNAPPPADIGGVRKVGW